LKAFFPVFELLLYKQYLAHEFFVALNKIFRLYCSFTSDQQKRQFLPVSTRINYKKLTIASA